MPARAPLPAFPHHLGGVPSLRSAEDELAAWASSSDDGDGGQGKQRDSTDWEDFEPRAVPGAADIRDPHRWPPAAAPLTPHMQAKLDRLKRPTTSSAAKRRDRPSAQKKAASAPTRVRAKADSTPPPSATSSNAKSTSPSRPPPQFTAAERRRAATASALPPTTPEDIERPSPAEARLAAALADLNVAFPDDVDVEPNTSKLHAVSTPHVMFADDTPSAPRTPLPLQGSTLSAAAAPALLQLADPSTEADDLDRRELELRAALADVGRARARKAWEDDASRVASAIETELAAEERLIERRCDEAVAALVVERAQWTEQFEQFRTRVHDGMAKLQAALAAAAEKEHGLDDAYAAMEAELRTECAKERDAARRRAEERLERRLAEAARAMSQGVGIAETGTSVVDGAVSDAFYGRARDAEPTTSAFNGTRLQ